MRVRSFCAAAVLFLCALFPGKGSCEAQRCEAEQFVACFQDAVRRMEFAPSEHNDTLETLEADCAIADAVPLCTRDTVLDGCADDQKHDLRFLERGFRLTRDSLCDKNLHEAMADWNRCLKRTVLDQCARRYEEERWNLTKIGRLTEEEDRCRFGGHTCLQMATEQCSLTSLATVSINNFLNTVFDLEDCPRPDGSSGRQRCDAERLTLCYSNVLDEINFRPSERNDTIQSLATDCAIVESVSSCRKDLIIEGCPDDSKEHLRLLESGFRSMRTSLCNPELYESMLEWNQCLDRVFLRPCLAEESWRRSNNTLLIMTGHSVVPYPRCSLGFYNCLLNATQSCPSGSLAKEAVHHFHNSHRDLEDCPRTGWNGGRCTRSPNVLLSLAAFCVSFPSLRKQLLFT